MGENTESVTLEIQDISGAGTATPPSAAAATTPPSPAATPTPPSATPPSAAAATAIPSADFTLSPPTDSFQDRGIDLSPTPPEGTDISINYTVPDKVSFRTVETIIRGLYTDTATTHSTALDILAIYLKGQKIIYTEAKVLCEMRLITLMLPAILTSCISTLLSLQLKDYQYGSLIVSCLTAFNAFLLSIISYLKLDAKAEGHKIAAYKYDKLQAFCEFKSGKILFLPNAKEAVETIIDSVETQVKEIKETNQFIIPEYIRHFFHRTYAVNVFSRVKEIQTEEMILLNDLKGIINEILMKTANPIKNQHDLRELLALNGMQNKKIKEILEKREKLLEIDNEFEDEIMNSIKAAKRARCNVLMWFNT